MADDQPEKKAKRRLKVETVRERAEKAAEPAKPKKRRLRQTTGAIARPLRFLRVFRFLRFLIPSYFRNSWREMKDVKWPDRKETTQLSVAVFIFAAIFAVIITIVDYGLDKVFKRILLK